jgi:hypothetical protein
MNAEDRDTDRAPASEGIGVVGAFSDSIDFEHDAEASPAAGARSWKLHAPSCVAEDLPSVLEAQAIELSVRALEAVGDAAELARSMGDGEADIEITHTADGKLFVHVNHQSGTAHGRYVQAAR